MKTLLQTLATVLVASTCCVQIAAAAGTLAISSVINTGSVVNVTGTCVQGAGPVKVWFKETTTGAQHKVYVSGGNCGATAATAGRTIGISPTVAPAGSYIVILKQGGATSAPAGPITLP